ncbi:hypothetical protein FIBSPDRAFT_847014 [Athelia psychrophila]|uniref:Uncharacterized protein n=1 Tax=Athelia psychrophila TaxID=1759441 RepID=A0A166WKM2_9AGAM|nr:hypothetical protein FIBSPDRAFT_847014 [Fibularhizoctonia sp. CBS 109695]
MTNSTVPPALSQSSTLGESSNDRARRRVHDLSVSATTQAATATLPAHVSRQINGTWLQDAIVERTAEQAELARVKALQKERELSAGRQIKFIWWDTSNQPARAYNIQNINASDWPACDITEVIEQRTGVSCSKIELLDNPSRTWYNIEPGHILHLKTGEHIFARACGVSCPDFDQQYRLFTHPPTMSNIRNNYSKERAYLRTKERQRKLRSVTESDSEVEVVHSPRPAVVVTRKKSLKTSKSTCKTSRKRRAPSSDDEIIEISDDDDPPFRSTTSSTSFKCARTMYRTSAGSRRPPNPKKPVIKVEHEHDWPPLDSDSEFDLPPTSIIKKEKPDPPSLTHSRSSSFMPSPTLPTLAPASSRSQSAKPSVWPSTWYVKDVTDGLRAMHKMKMRREKDLQTVEARFCAAFPGTAFVRSTYYDATKRLDDLDQSDIDAAVAAGHTPAGSWAELAKKVPLRSK